MIEKEVSVTTNRTYKTISLISVITIAHKSDLIWTRCTTKRPTLLSDNARSFQIALVGDDDDRFGVSNLVTNGVQQVDSFLVRPSVGDRVDDDVTVDVIVSPRVQFLPRNRNHMVRWGPPEDKYTSYSENAVNRPNSAFEVTTLRRYINQFIIIIIIIITRRSTLGDRAFLVAAARAWNSLPPAVRDAPSLLSFRSRTDDMAFWTDVGLTLTLPGCTSFRLVFCITY